MGRYCYQISDSMTQCSLSFMVSVIWIYIGTKQLSFFSCPDSKEQLLNILYFTIHDVLQSRGVLAPFYR